MPSLKYAIGRAANRAMHAALRHPWFPLAREVPNGLSTWYDIQRLAGRRDLCVIFDVGANVGQTAYQLVRYFPRAQIHCFEPVALTFQQLSKQYGTQVTCHRMALGDKYAQMEISTFSNPELNTFADGRADAVPLGREVVTVDTVDRFCEAHGIQRIDVLKMDVQGWEMNVLRGALKMLQGRCVKFILAEVGFRARDRDMQDFGELNSYLDALGFELCGFYDVFRWGPGRALVGFANALYSLPDSDHAAQ